MPDIKVIHFNSLGNVTIIRKLNQDSSVVYFEANTSRGEDIIVQRYLEEEPYSAIRNTITRLQGIRQDSISMPFYPSHTVDHYVARKPVGGQYPIKAEAWKDLSAQLEACTQICDVFKELDSRSFVIKAFNEKCLDIDPQTGKVRIDILNCIEHLSTFKPLMAIPGKYVLTADEMKDVSEHPAKALGFPLTVLLFEVLVGSHPFDGRALRTKAFVTEEDLLDNYGPKRTFIFDPENNCNAPVPGIQESVIRHWHALPEEIKETFIQSFTKTNGFPSPKGWLNLIEKAKENVIVCPSCGKKAFFKIRDRKACGWCGRNIDATHVLKVFISGKEIPIIEGTEIKISSSSGVIGKVVRINDKLLIRNMTRRPWSARTPSDASKQVDPNGNMPVIPGIKVKIGTDDCVIE